MISQSEKKGPGKKKKIKALNLKKETVKNLTNAEANRVKGGLITISLVGVRSGVRSRASRI